LLAPDYRERSRRLNFTLLFIAGCSAAALLLNSLYGISKDDATPSWCLWSCAVTAALWLGFDYLERSPAANVIARPFRTAGQNVLLAYLLSEMLPNPLHWGTFAEAAGLWSEVACSLVWAAVVLAMSAGLNKAGFRLRI
jgi:heparan-alpha-glucosaminide N-acetyltransferase